MRVSSAALFQLTVRESQANMMRVFDFTSMDITSAVMSRRNRDGMTEPGTQLIFSSLDSQLPTGSRRYTQSQVKDENLWLCPCCKQAKDTIPHLLQCCSNPEFNSSLENLREDICKSETHPVRHLIYAGIWHFSSQPDTLLTPDLESYPTHLRPLISEALASQSEIGWYQATKGFLSKKWLELASQSMFQIGLLDDNKGLTCMKSIMRAIHDHSIRIWKSRNQVLHSKDDEELDRIRSVVTAEITLLHGQPEFMCTSLSREGDPSTF
jgi:hypothetical protein